MLLTILSVHTTRAAATCRASAREVVAPVIIGAAVIIGGAVGMLAWEKMPLLIGFCVHF